MSDSKVYAVVTGGSRGLGKAFAIELSKRGISTVLVSSNESVASLCEELKKKYCVDAQFVVADLTQRNDILRAAEEINRRFSIFMLINNAGIGGSQAFDKVDVAYLEKIIGLNVLAPSLLTKQLLPNLLMQPQSYILNVSSMAAYTPIGYKMVYPASKSFVRSFSLSLRAEYAGRGLSVSVVSPGAMATSQTIRERIEKQGFLGKLTLVSPDVVAAKCIRQTLRGKREIYVNPISCFFSQWIPQCFRTVVLTHIVKKEVE